MEHCLKDAEFCSYCRCRRVNLHMIIFDALYTFLAVQCEATGATTSSVCGQNIMERKTNMRLVKKELIITWKLAQNNGFDSMLI